jgi:hypothetical protein
MHGALPLRIYSMSRSLVQYQGPMNPFYPLLDFLVDLFQQSSTHCLTKQRTEAS